MHMRMRAGLAADGRASRLQFANLLPRHVTIAFGIDRLGGHKERKGHVERLEAWPCFFIYGQIGIIDGDGDGTVRKRLA